MTGWELEGPATVALAIYAAGVLVGLARTDARPPARVGLAAAWPIGPLAFAVTISVLLAASTIAFPAIGLAVLAAAGLLMLLF